MTTAFELARRTAQQNVRDIEVEMLIGDASKAKRDLGWETKTNIDELVEIMMDYDKKELLS